MAKATDLEYDKRIETVKRLILDGADTDEICQDVTARFGVSTRQALRYVSDARNRLQRRIDADRNAMLAEHIAHRRDMRKRAIAAKDLRAELAIVQDEAKLWGLYPADKREVTGADGGPLQIVIKYANQDIDADPT